MTSLGLRSLLYVVPALAAGAALLVPPPAAGTLSPTVTREGERFTVLSGRARPFADSRAYGDSALVQRSNGTATGTLVTGPVEALVLRLRGDQFRGAPRAVVRVDGERVATLSVASSRWMRYEVPGAWPAGTRRVRISFVNDLSVAGFGDRNLRVDRVSFVAAAAPSPSPAPSASATPQPTPTSPSPTATTTPAPTASTTPSPTPTPAPTTTPAPTITTPPAPTPTLSPDAAYEARIVELVNMERSKAGLKPLAVSSCAEGYARSWSATMAKSGAFEHRSDLGAVMRTCGARGVGENIAFGNVTADAMMAMWMGSTGHRANILRPSYTHIGVGIARTSSGRVYGTQNFLAN